RRHRELRNFAGMDVGAEPHDLLFGAVHHFELERCAGVIMPDLDGIDAMPVRAFAARQQEIDRGGGGAAVDHARVAERLAVVAALGVRRERERTDDIGGGVGHARRQNLFLRARISANTCAAALPVMPMPAATSGRSARRNGLASFSSPMVTGIVGSPLAICCLTCTSRAASTALAGSMVRAKRILAAVYSCPQ